MAVLSGGLGRSRTTCCPTRGCSFRRSRRTARRPCGGSCSATSGRRGTGRWPTARTSSGYLERLQEERARRSTRLQFEGVLAAVAVAAAFEPETRVGDTASEEASLLHAGLLHLLRGDAERAGRISQALGGGVTGATVVQRSRPLARLLLARLDGRGLSGAAPSTRSRLGALLAPYVDQTVAEGGLADLVGELALWGDETSPAAVVTLSTYHSAKGLEFEHVYCLGATVGCFPMWNETGDPEKVSERRRVLYVGMTRAERSLTVTYAERNRWNKPAGPSAFLSGLPAEHHVRAEA